MIHNSPRPIGQLTAHIGLYTLLHLSVYAYLIDSIHSMWVQVFCFKKNFVLEISLNSFFGQELTLILELGETFIGLLKAKPNNSRGPTIIPFVVMPYLSITAESRRPKQASGIIDMDNSNPPHIDFIVGLYHKGKLAFWIWARPKAYNKIRSRQNKLYHYHVQLANRFIEAWLCLSPLWGCV